MLKFLKQLDILDILDNHIIGGRGEGGGVDFKQMSSHYGWCMGVEVFEMKVMEYRINKKNMGDSMTNILRLNLGYYREFRENIGYRTFGWKY